MKVKGDNMKNQRRSNQARSILIISALDFWSMGKGKGGPALYRTLTGYAERGLRI